jgi:hypothetical protein
VSQTHLPARSRRTSFNLERLGQIDEGQFSHGHNMGASHA